MWRSVDFEAKTFFLGIGAQKAGTSWIRSYLARRPDVYIASGEMHFFDSRRSGNPRRRKRKMRARKRDLEDGKSSALLDLKLDYLERKDARSAYKEFFRSRVPEDTHVFGEITPSYALVGKPGYRAVHEVFPNARVFFVMRDPAERLYSQRRMTRNRRQRRTGKEAGLSLDELLNEAASDKRSLYQLTVRNLEAVFAREQILYLFYEQLFQPQTVEDLCKFLGLPYVAANFEEVVHPGGPRDEIPEEIDREVRALFRATYRFCREKFGKRLPAEWRCP